MMAVENAIRFGGGPVVRRASGNPAPPRFARQTLQRVAQPEFVEGFGAGAELTPGGKETVREMKA